MSEQYLEEQERTVQLRVAFRNVLAISLKHLAITSADSRRTDLMDQY